MIKRNLSKCFLFVILSASPAIAQVPNVGFGQGQNQFQGQDQGQGQSPMNMSQQGSYNNGNMNQMQMSVWPTTMGLYNLENVIRFSLPGKFSSNRRRVR